MSGVGAWIRYGGPIRPDEVPFAAEHYRTAILQPWELEVASELKRRRPDMTILAYKCLSSTRDYEPGPTYSSGVGHGEAMEAKVAGSDWFASRRDGSRIEWRGYPGHWQMNVRDPGYRARWVRNVATELLDSPFDGVMADNDVFDDYYGLQLPIREAATMADLREGLDRLVEDAGRALNSIQKILVPNIAESRRQPGRWVSHAAYGGGFEEAWLGFGAADLFDPVTAEAQLGQAAGPGLTILRVPTDGCDSHANFTYGLAAFWIFGGGAGAYSATGHDDYNRTPFIPELDWHLGAPIAFPETCDHVWWREFTSGWAAVNLNASGRPVRPVAVPAGLIDHAGLTAPSEIELPPRQGILLRRSPSS